MVSEIAAGSKPNKPICHISSGEILATVLREFPEIYDICECYSGPYNVIEKLAHKDQMYEVATHFGLETAPFVTLDKYTPGILQFPMFLKRNYEIPLFFKAERVNNEEEFNRLVSRIPPEARKDVLVQKLIDVPERDITNITCQGFFHKGELLGSFVADQKRRLKKGLTSYIEEIDEPTLISEILSSVEPMMQSLGYDGFAEFEFIRDKRSGRNYFLEVNTRPCGSQSVLGYKFKNLSQILLQPGGGVKLERVNKNIRWMNITRDIRARVESHNMRNPFDIFRSKFDILNWSDFKPFLYQFVKK